MSIPEFKKLIKHYIDSFDDSTEGAEDRGDEAAGIIYYEIHRHAIDLGLPRVAEVCQEVTTTHLAPITARIVLCECLGLITSDSDLLTVKQAAEKLGVSARTVYDLVESGRLRAKRIGIGRGTIRIQPDDLVHIGDSEPSFYRHLV